MRLLRLVLRFSAWLILSATPTHDLEAMVNNGLAPPNPENVYDPPFRAFFDWLFVRNAGCAPDWPTNPDPHVASPTPGPSTPPPPLMA